MSRPLPTCSALFAFLTAPALLAVAAFVAVAVLTALGAIHPTHALPLMAVGATSFSSSATKVNTLADLYEKTNTDVKIGVKLTTEEAKWFQDYPREQITVSGNENRVPVLLTKPTMPAMIPEGGNESVMQSPAPTHGTFMPVQMNRRYGFTGLSQALEARAKAAMIESQVAFQANMAIVAIRRAVGLQTYGQSTGTVAVVKTTGTAGTAQTVPLENAYGSSTFVDGTTTPGKQYLHGLFQVDDIIALIRSAAIVEFGKVTAVPGASGDGSIDVTFTSSITPTVGDLIVFANADGDNTIAGTDVNNWPIGFTELCTASSVLGIDKANFAEWDVGSSNATAERLGFVQKERMINECYNKSGVTINRFIVDQATRRDAIQQQRDLLRYSSTNVDLEGDLDAGSGEKIFTSQLAMPGVLLGWFDQAYRKVELSDLPAEGGGKSIFKLDKVQGKDQIAASYNYFYAKIPSSRRAVGYHSNLTGQ